MQKAAAWVNYQVEREGIARLTILILVLTTVCMLSFTWGYAEVRQLSSSAGSMQTHPFHLPTSGHSAESIQDPECKQSQTPRTFCCWPCVCWSVSAGSAQQQE